MYPAPFTRRIYVAVLLLFALVVLAGCGSKSPEPGDAPSSTAPKPKTSAPQAVNTLSVEEAVQATVQADQAARARAAEATRVAQFTPTPTPLSHKDFNKEVEKSLARATAVASVYQSVVSAEGLQYAKFLGVSISLRCPATAGAYTLWLTVSGRSGICLRVTRLPCSHLG